MMFFFLIYNLFVDIYNDEASIKYVDTIGPLDIQSTKYTQVVWSACPEIGLLI